MQDNTIYDKPLHTTTQDQLRNYKPRQYNTRHGNTKQNNACHDKTRQYNVT